VDGVEDFIIHTKPIFELKIWFASRKNLSIAFTSEKLQQQRHEPGVIQYGLEKMSISTDAVAGVGQKSCRFNRSANGRACELYFAKAGQCRDAKIGSVEGDDGRYKVVLWTAGEFEIDFNAANASTKTTRRATRPAVLKKAMRYG